MSDGNLSKKRGRSLKFVQADLPTPEGPITRILRIGQSSKAGAIAFAAAKFGEMKVI
jgi:hypothetical protein